MDESNRHLSKRPKIERDALHSEPRAITTYMLNGGTLSMSRPSPTMNRHERPSYTTALERALAERDGENQNLTPNQEIEALTD
jgi:hypothetical protein